MFNEYKYNILITSVKDTFNYNDKEANRLIYHITHDLLKDAIIEKYKVSDMDAQIIISTYNLNNNIL